MGDTRKSELIIGEWKKRGGREGTVDVEEDRVKMVVFTLGTGHFAFPGSDVKEILPRLDVWWVPGAPDFLPGVINNRGDIESVINLSRLLGLPDGARTPASRVVMATRDGVRSGILVDTVVDVVDVPVSAVKPPLPTLDAALLELVSGEMTLGGKTVVVLDVGRLFGRTRTHGR